MEEFRISLLDIDDAVETLEFADRHYPPRGSRSFFDPALRFWANRAAFRALTRLTNDGDPEAPLHLGRMYRTGQGPADYDFLIARHWTEVSAERGFLPAYDELADWLLVSFHEADEAYRWFIRAAERGQVDSLAEAADALSRPKLLARQSTDDSNALPWLQLALDRGSIRAQYYMGAWHEAGLGGLEKDLNEAVVWYEKAALSGSVDGYIRLISLLSGQVAEKEQVVVETSGVIDVEAAYKWALVFFDQPEIPGLDPRLIPGTFAAILLEGYWDDTLRLYQFPFVPADYRGRIGTFGPGERIEHMQGRIETSDRIHAYTVEVLNTPLESAPSPPIIAGMPYRIDTAAMRRAEESAREYLARHPVPAP